MNRTLEYGLLFALLFPSTLWAKDKHPIEANVIYEFGQGLKLASILQAGTVVPPLTPLLKNDVDCVYLTVIAQNGSPTDMQPVLFTNSAYDDAVKQAIELTTFAPGTLKGEPVATRIYLHVHFYADKSAATLEQLDQDKSAAFVTPKLLKSVDAEFTDDMRRNKKWGDVSIGLLVNYDGIPTGVHVIHSTCLDCNENSLKAVKQYRFKPATLNGIPVLAPLYVVVTFRIF